MELLPEPRGHRGARHTGNLEVLLFLSLSLRPGVEGDQPPHLDGETGTERGELLVTGVSGPRWPRGSGRSSTRSTSLISLTSRRAPLILMHNGAKPGLGACATPHILRLLTDEERRSYMYYG